MRSTYKFAALTLAVLLTMALAFARYRNRAEARPGAAIPAMTPTTNDDKILRDILSAHEVPATANQIANLKRARRARLQEKGEALWGAKPDRIETATGTARGTAAAP